MAEQVGRGRPALGDNARVPGHGVGELSMVWRWAVLAFIGAACVVRAETPAATSPVYRCPGPPVLYTDAMSPEEARAKGCRVLEAGPITVFQSPPKPRPAAASGGASAARGAETRVDPAAQRKLDSGARQILEAELRREEERLAELRSEFNNGEPERRGDERNYQRYLDRVADMKTAIARKESDIAAIKRELSKLPP
jgi:hypothetical protein